MIIIFFNKNYNVKIEMKIIFCTDNTVLILGKYSVINNALNADIHA